MKTYVRSNSLSVPGNATSFCHVAADLEDGYRLLGAVGASTGHGSVVLQGFRVDEGKGEILVECHNLTAGQLSVIVTVYVLALMVG